MRCHGQVKVFVKKALLFVAVLAALIFGIWTIAIPDYLVADMISGALEGDVSVKVKGVKKGLPFTFRVERVTFSRAGSELLSVGRVSARLNPLPLLLLKLSLGFSGSISGGSLKGEIVLSKGHNTGRIEIVNAQAGGIPLFSLMGFEGGGVFSGTVNAEDGEGAAQFEIRDAAFKAASFGGVSVPLDMFYLVRGAVSMKGGTTTISSFSMEGSGIHARVRGTIRETVLEGTMELMPDRVYRESNAVFTLIRNYEVSPGYYAIPLRKTLAL